MNKYATVFAMTITTSGLAAVWLLADPQNNSIDVRAIWANECQVDERSLSYRCFKATFQSTNESLRKGELSLREAHTIIRESASRFNPNFLEHLSFAETGKTVTARLAQNLVGHIRSLERTHPSVPSPLPRLESELREMLAEIDEPAAWWSNLTK